MNKFTRTLMTVVLAAVMTFGVGAGVLAQSVPSDSTATGTITLQVHAQSNNLWVGVTAGTFSTVQAGSDSSGKLDMAVEDDRPADQIPWYVSASISDFATADNSSSFSAPVTWVAQATSGTLPTAVQISGTPAMLWHNAVSQGKAPSATANGTGMLTVPADTATGQYSSTITVTIQGTDPNA